MIELLVPKEKFAKQIFILWFILALTALSFSGIYSFLPYALRTPFIVQYLDFKHLFAVSLMVHVNLGVLVWFLSCCAMLMIMVTKQNFMPASLVAFLASMVGTVFIIASPFFGPSEAIKNDYIPILHNLSFIIGISLFITGICLQVLLTLLSYKKISSNLINFTVYMNALIFLVAVICFIRSNFELQKLSAVRSLDLLEYYQLLFWGSGHVLQFCYVQLVIIAWMCFLKKISPNFLPSRTFIVSTQIANLIIVVLCIAICFKYSIDSFEFYNFFTIHMKHLGGLLMIAMAIYILMHSSMKFKIENIALYSSLFLILSGGFIGYLISGVNVTIPAHYHGVILGITSGLMGMFYFLMPKLGFRKIDNKSAIWQIILYGLGQFIHVVALAISGGYGVLRKDPSNVTFKAKLFMAAMGIGGTLALLGGVIFIVLIFRNMKVDNE